MSETTTISGVKIPKIKNVEQAIAMDNSLVYSPLPKPLFRQIKQEDVETAEVEGMEINAQVIKQIQQYALASYGTPQLISYKGKILKAVSGSFKPIRLQDIWDVTVTKLGEPSKQRVISQGVVCEFPKVTTEFDRNFQETDEYELTPIVVFSYNFAQRSFALGFCTTVMNCTNQLFFFCGAMKTRIVHNYFHMRAQDFQLNKTLDQFKKNWKIVENLIEENKEKPIAEYDVPVYYWKASNGTAMHIDNMYQQHHPKDENGEPTGEFKFPKTTWDIAMNITYVSSHEVPKFNTSFDISSRAGNFLCKDWQLYNYDYVLSLGYYMRSKAIAHGEIFQTVNLEALKAHVRSLIPPKEQSQYTDNRYTPDDSIATTEVPKQPKEPKRVSIPIQEAVKGYKNDLRYYL